MTNSIMIDYPPGSSANIKVDYAIEMIDDVQTICCVVDSVKMPIWLQLRKFYVSSRKLHGSYTQLYDEMNNSRNMDTSLFIDLVYKNIMAKERLKICQ